MSLFSTIMSIFNKNFVTKILLIIISVVILLVVIVFLFIIPFIALKWFSYNFKLPDHQTLRVSYLEQYIKFVQILLVSVFVTIISAIIPHIISRERDRFEQYKESRLAYSRAKTAVLYLPDRVVSVDDREKAFLLVEKAHRELHFAETFKNLIINRKYLSWFANPKLWIIYNYWQIVAVAEVLREFEIDWSISKNKNELKEILKRTLDVVHRRFGRTGEKCKDEKWEIVNSSRYSKYRSIFYLEDEKWKITSTKCSEYKSRFDEEDEIRGAIEGILKKIKRSNR